MFCFFPQKLISFEPTTTYLLKDLKPFTTYTFRLAARSKHGVGAYTNEISAETPQTRRSSSLSDRVLSYLGRNTFSNAFKILSIPQNSWSDKNARKLLGSDKQNASFLSKVDAFENSKDVNAQTWSVFRSLPDHAEVSPLKRLLGQCTHAFLWSQGTRLCQNTIDSTE